MNNRTLMIAFVACLSPVAMGQTPPSPSPHVSPSMSHSTNPSSVTPANPGGPGALKSVTAADKTFIAAAVQGDLAEVRMGQLAQQSGASAGVKEFGKMLEQDHGQHLVKAQDMAIRAGVTSPTEVSAEQQNAYDKLAKTSGAAFDSAFVAEMIRDHNEDIAKYEKQARSGGAFAGFAQQTLPTLQTHLKAAQDLGRSK